ncbi:MAG: hypothetical protein DWQ05_00330 [Calditrichaeota bacterium]|nr:MAG: hypothetical protein DWQ05_00330 [Calditrichota bacterium]
MLNRKILRYILSGAIVFFVLLPALTAQNDQVVVDQSIMQSTTVSNRQLISLFSEDFMIPEEDISRLVIYDLSGDGFGEGDIARTFPGGRFYMITPSARTQNIMNNWSFGGNIKFTANSNDSPELFENAPDSVRAMGGIFAALLRGMRRNYSGEPIKMHLEQVDGVTSIEMWGYSPELMHYVPPPINKVPEEIPVMKLIYLEKTVVDSVYSTPR